MSMWDGPIIWRRKRGLIRRPQARWQPGDALLCTDWTLLRLFPPLRAAWAMKGAQAFLAELRRRYRRADRIWLLADRASAHTARSTLALAERLNIQFVWLPKQARRKAGMHSQHS